MNDTDAFTPYTLDWEPGQKEASLKVLAEAGIEMFPDEDLPQSIDSNKYDQPGRPVAWRGWGGAILPEFEVEAASEVIHVRVEERPWGLKFCYSVGCATACVENRQLECLILDAFDTDVIGLHLVSCSPNFDLNSLSNLHRLKKLTLIGCSSLSDLSALASLRSLRELYVKNCEFVSDINFISGLRNLETLSLHKSDFLEHIHPLSSLNKLKYLDMSGCPRLSDISALSSLADLRELDLSSSKLLKNLDALSGLRQLVSLGLSSCDILKDISPLATLRQLRHLNLNGCAQLSEIETLSSLPGLRQLDLSYCESIRDLSPLASLSRLEELRFENCKLEGLESLGGLGNLRALSLANSNFSCMPHFVEELINLRSLELFMCPFLKEEQLSFLFRFSELRRFTHDNTVFEHQVLLNSAILRSDIGKLREMMDGAFTACVADQNHDLALLLIRASRLIFEADTGSSKNVSYKEEEIISKMFMAFYKFEESSSIFWLNAFVEIGSSRSKVIWLWLSSSAEPVESALLEGILDFVAIGSCADAFCINELDGLLNRAEALSLSDLGPKICLAYRSLGQADLADEWLKRLTKQSDTSLRDRVLALYAERDLAEGALESARECLAGIESRPIADSVRASLARALAASAPEEAGALLEAVLQSEEKAALATELQQVSGFTAVEANLQRLLLIQATDPEAFEGLLAQLLEWDAENPWLQELRAQLIGGSKSAENADRETQERYLRKLVAEGVIDLSQVAKASSFLGA